MGITHKIIMGVSFIVGAVSPALPASVKTVEYKPRQYEFDTKFTIVNGINICYADVGSGERTIIFVHGLTGSMDNWTQSILRFSKNNRVIALDLPGHGNSERRNNIPYGIPLFAEVVKGLMDQLGVKKAVVMGNSMGGQTVCYFAWKYPDRCEAIVLSDSAGIKTNFPRLANFFLEHSNKIKLAEKMTKMNRHSVARGGVGMMGDFTRDGKHGGGLPMFWDSSKPNSKKWIADMQAWQKDFIWTDEYPKYNYAIIMSSLGIFQTPMKNKLAEIKVPTLIVWGDHDGLVPIQSGYVFLHGIKGSDMIVIPDCGHVPAVEEPDAFNAGVETFLLTLPK